MSLRSLILPSLITTMLSTIALTCPAEARGGGHYGHCGIVSVRGYVTHSGVYVAPHYRTAPDHNFYNNWSSSGNINPYTGKMGTRVMQGSSYAYYSEGRQAANGVYSPVSYGSVSVSSLPSPPPLMDEDPMASLHTYYGLISQARKDEAFEMRSTRSKSSTSKREFTRVWSNNLWIRLDRAALLSSQKNHVTLAVRLISSDKPSPDSSPKITAFVGIVKLTFENGVWRYDGADVQAE